MKNSPANDDKTKIRLGVFEKYYMQHIEEISQLKSALQNMKQKQSKDAMVQVGTKKPNVNQIIQFELDNAQAENQRLRDEFDEKDKIINKIQKVLDELIETTKTKIT